LDENIGYLSDNDSENNSSEAGSINSNESDPLSIDSTLSQHIPAARPITGQGLENHWVGGPVNEGNNIQMVPDIMDTTNNEEAANFIDTSEFGKSEVVINRGRNLNKILGKD
jgi:hypothetical protein